MERRTAAQQSLSFNILYRECIEPRTTALAHLLGGDPIDHGSQRLMFMFPTRYYAKRLLRRRIMIDVNVCCVDRV